jgi:hypothetical protein
MGKPKTNGMDRNTISDIFQHFGQKQEHLKSFLIAASLNSADMKTAAIADCLPAKNQWGKIKKAATANGWKPPEVKQ